MSNAIPSTMKAIQLTRFDGIEGLEIVEKPVPQPKAGEVLIKMVAAPVNPSDLVFFDGNYTGSPKTPPVIAGFEGSGDVVAAGSGLVGSYMNGKRVACGSTLGDGTWAEYLVIPANLCIPLQNDVTYEQGATLIVNPFTAYVLVSLAKKAKAKAIIQTAAASQVGRMVLRLCQQENLPAVHIVRREAQVQLLKDMGASYVLNSSDDDFEEQLQEVCQRLDVSYALDAVGSTVASQVFTALVDGGTINIYGVLSEAEATPFDTRQMIFNNKNVTGFWLSEWFPRQNILTILRYASKIQGQLGSTLATTFQNSYSLDDAIGGIQHYKEHMTDGKILIKP